MNEQRQTIPVQPRLVDPASLSHALQMRAAELRQETPMAQLGFRQPG